MIESIAAKAEMVSQADHNFTVREDGIAYCNQCGKPRQKWIDLVGSKTFVSFNCECLEAETGKANPERVEQLQLRGGVSPACTFDSAQPSKVMDKCKRYADRWDEVQEKGAGLLLWGGVGTGKTFAAHCVANELIKQDISVFVTSLSRALNSGFDKTDILRRIRETPLVCFDDLGAERSSEYALEQVFMLVDERYRTRKPLIVTTNLTLDEIRHPKDIDRKRIYDRILQRCVPLHFDGGSKREEESVEMLRFMRKLLEEEGPNDL